MNNPGILILREWYPPSLYHPLKFILRFLFNHRYSEKSKTKCIGITIETRPDYCLKRHLLDMLRYGCTRLEIGVQSVYEDVARDTNRGHTVSAYFLLASENLVWLVIGILFAGQSSH